MMKPTSSNVSVNMCGASGRTPQAIFWIEVVWHCYRIPRHRITQWCLEYKIPPVFLRTWSRSMQIPTAWFADSERPMLMKTPLIPDFWRANMWVCCQVWCTWQGRQGCKIRCTPKIRAKNCDVHNSLMFLFQGKMVSFKILVFSKVY